jgi:hypothetical protein
MKKTIFITSLLLMMASAAMAGKGPINNVPPEPVGIPPLVENPVDRPARPVPEPGTMALASMGLIALGAALRGRHK